MSAPDDSLAAAEQTAVAALATDLKDHARLAVRASNLITGVLASLPDAPFNAVPQSCKVCAGLLIKIANDLRTAALLAGRGYPVQAATIASSLYESAVTVAFIGTDDALAEAWITHGTSKPLENFKPVWKMTEAAVARTGQGADVVERLFRIYTQLCWAKHGSSLFLIHQSYTRVGSDYIASNGPNTSDPALRAAFFGLEQAVALVFLATGAFIEDHVPERTREALGREWAEVGRERAELAARSHARWPRGDPFPGQWRTAKRASP